MADFCCRNCTELAAAIRAECDGDETTMQAVLLIIQVEDFLKDVAQTTDNSPEGLT